MHAIALGGCTDAVREESALEVDSGRKGKKKRKKKKRNLATPGTQTRRQHYAWLLSEKLYESLSKAELFGWRKDQLWSEDEERNISR